MQITTKKIEELQIIYKETFGIDLSEDEALDIGLQMVTLVKAILPINLSKICKK